MAQQVQKTKTYQEKQADQKEAKALAEADTERQAEIRKDGEKTISDIDALLDEIDDLLEENAEMFVRAYQQKGGE